MNASDRSILRTMVTEKNSKLIQAIEEFQANEDLDKLCYEFQHALSTNITPKSQNNIEININNNLKDHKNDEEFEYKEIDHSLLDELTQIINEKGLSNEVKTSKEYDILDEEIVCKKDKDNSLALTQPISFGKTRNQLSETEANFKELLAESKSFLNAKSKQFSSAVKPSKARKNALNETQKIINRAKLYTGDISSNEYSKTNKTNNNIKVEIKEFNENYYRTFRDKPSPNFKEEITTLRVPNVTLRNCNVDNKENNVVQDLPKYEEKSKIIDNIPSIINMSMKVNEKQYDDLLPSARTVDIFNEYTKKATMNKIDDKNYILAISTTSLLRYISLKDVLYELASTSIKKCNKIGKKDFYEAVMSLAKERRLNFDPDENDLRHSDLDIIYDTIKEETETRLSLEELAGGLSALCSGSMEDKIRIALVYIGSKDGKINFSIAFKFLQSLYKMLLSQPSTSIKNSNIDSKELSHMTILQCFDDYKRNYDKALTIEQFTRWFLSQVKTLMPQCENTISIMDHYGGALNQEPEPEPEPEPEIGLNPSEMSSNFGFQLESVYGNCDNSQHEFSQPYSYYEAPNNDSSNVCLNLQESQRQWQQFLNHHYTAYGFYPLPPSVNTCRDTSIISRTEKATDRTGGKRQISNKTTGRNDHYMGGYVHPIHNFNDSKYYV